MAVNVLDTQVRTADGREISLSEYKGHALLIVNVASKCGYTPQYAGLEALFPIFEKIEVNGPNRSPLYAILTQVEPAGDVQWNFEKFVVSKDGAVVGRFRSRVAPDSPELVTVIERELRK